MKADFQKDGSKINTDKVEIDFDAGVLKWDSVDHAQYYDVYADIALASYHTPFILGKYWIKDTKNFEHINDKKEVEELPFTQQGTKKWTFIQDPIKKDVNSVRVAYGLANNTGDKANQISLKDFIPVALKNTTFLEELVKDDDYCTIVISIIPRNTDSLYITKLDSAKPIGNVLITDASFRDGFLKKFNIE